MYGAIRVILVFLAFVLVLKKVELNKVKRTVLLVLTVLVCTISAFVPVENLFVDFSSPEAVYKYRNLQAPEELTVVYGEESAMVIAQKDQNSYNVRYTPKSEDGWKIGNALNVKSVYCESNDGFSIDVKRYGKTTDYYIEVKSTGKQIEKITDSENSEFISLGKSENDTESEFVFYYTAVQNFNNQYWIDIDGEKISFGE